MKKVILRKGLLSFLVIGITGYVNFLLSRGATDFGMQETLGYVFIVLSLVFVFFGIKQYRDKVNGGTVSYGKAFLVGFLIVLFPAIAFGLFDVIYVKYLDPGFAERYYNAMMQKMQVSMPPAAFQRKTQEMRDEMKMFSNLPIQFAVMAATVILIGIPITALSSLILCRKPKNMPGLDKMAAGK